MICYPYKVTLGTIRECIDKGATHILMYKTEGTCRFRHYAELQEKTLKSRGYEFTMLATSWKHPLKIMKWVKDLGIPYFKFVRETIKLINKIRKLDRGGGKKEGLNIGLVGEFYTLIEEGVNLDIGNKLKQLGVNVDISITLSSFLTHKVVPWHKRKVKKERKEYLHDKIGGHGCESIYNTIDYCRKGYDGIIHLLPLSCMPESTVSVLLDMICKKYNIPIMHIPMDENNSEGLFNTRIEAFVGLMKRKDLNVSPLKEEGYFLGIDVGSVSVDFALIDNQKNVIKTSYLSNEGIAETIKKGLKEFREYKIKGNGITGSGRKFASMIVGADVVPTEILAHAIGTNQFVPDFNTIFEIGGEDSKLMIRKSDNSLDFAMNISCGGGTGSMIKSIANRMGVKIEDVGELSLKGNNNLTLDGKCGIFCQSSVVHHINTFDAKKEDILKGVCKALIGNYLAMVAQGKELKPPYVFQGGTSLNIGLINALEEALQHKIIVPKYNTVMGAIGAAMLALEKNPEKSKFKGCDAEIDILTENFNCKDCTNNCEIFQVKDKDSKVNHSWGSKCGKLNI